MPDTVELSLDRRSFKALVALVERARPRTSDEMAVYEMLQGEADDEEEENEPEEDGDDEEDADEADVIDFLSSDWSRAPGARKLQP